MVEDEWPKVAEIQDALKADDVPPNAVLNVYDNLTDFRAALNKGEISPATADAVMLDGYLGSTRVIGGLEAYREMSARYLVRNPDIREEEIDPGLLATIGISRDDSVARRLGTYTEAGRLTVNWGEQPLQLAHIVSEVRRLKPLA
jgi:hypothetical protein